MKLLTKIAELFSRKTSAQSTVEEDITLPGQPTRAVRNTISIGVCSRAYSPNVLALWLSTYLNKKISPSEIKMLDFFDTSPTKEYLLTAFTYKTEKDIFWVQVGSWNIYKISPQNISCDPCATFRLVLKDKPMYQYVAICAYKDEKIIVQDIVRWHSAPPTDNDDLSRVKCPILPCSVNAALRFLEFK